LEKKKKNSQGREDFSGVCKKRKGRTPLDPNEVLALHQKKGPLRKSWEKKMVVTAHGKRLAGLLKEGKRLSLLNPHPRKRGGQLGRGSKPLVINPRAPFA